MGTLEILIVFAALMAVIALVAIAIDWVGRPFKTRRFIPRIYRYDDEIAAEPNLSPAVHAAAPVAPTPGAPGPFLPPVHQPPVVATVPASLAPRAPQLPGSRQGGEPASTFAAQIDESETRETSSADGAGDLDSQGTRNRGIAQTIPEAAAPAWEPGMPLDTRTGEDPPTAAVKAERFWRETAANVSEHSHFDEANLERMHAGKAATRRNPRSGDIEAIELLGLRSASHRSDIRMVWPGDAIDPWSAA